MFSKESLEFIEFLAKLLGTASYVASTTQDPVDAVVKLFKQLQYSMKEVECEEIENSVVCRVPCAEAEVEEYTDFIAILCNGRLVKLIEKEGRSVKSWSSKNYTVEVVFD